VKPGAPGWPTPQPDVDKLSRSVLDACKEIVWRDDAQVVLKTVMKVYTTKRPGCSVEISPMEDVAGRHAEEMRESGQLFIDPDKEKAARETERALGLSASGAAL